VWGNGALSQAEGGTGSGCSSFEPKPSWQTDTGCGNRTVADVSAVADPNTGVAVFDSTPNAGQSGWLVFGGTSVSSPIIAAVYALAGNAASTSGASLAYSSTGSLNDVTSGSNGVCGSYLCTGGAGYDGPTGLGTPAGTGAF
jgi:subtilase family serine protease